MIFQPTILARFARPLTPRQPETFYSSVPVEIFPDCSRFGTCPEETEPPPEEPPAE